MADNLHVTTELESPADLPTKAKNLVKQHVQNTRPGFVADAYYVVWFCFILGGWKALVSSTNPDGRYYEVTYNRTKGETYIDTYEKIENVEIKDV